MALIARSIEMSFSASRLRRTLRSISIGLLLVRAVVRGVIQPGELDLNPPRAEVAIAEPPGIALHVERHAAGIRLADPAVHAVRPGRRLIRRRLRVPLQRSGDQAADRAPPVPRLGERAVNARRGDLQGVGRLAHRGRLVEHGRKLPADVLDIIEADAAGRVHEPAQQPAPAGRGDPDALQVHAQARDGRLQQPGQQLGVDPARWSGSPLGLGRPQRTVTGVTAHHNLLAAASAVPMTGLQPSRDAPLHAPAWLAQAIGGARRRSRDMLGGCTRGMKGATAGGSVTAGPTRRVMLTASAALPLVALAGCKGVGALAAPPAPAPDVDVLTAAIAGEQLLIARYEAVLAVPRDRAGGLAATLEPLLAQHRAHLAQLRSSLIVPPGAARPSPSPSARRPP